MKRRAIAQPERLVVARTLAAAVLLSGWLWASFAPAPALAQAQAQTPALAPPAQPMSFPTTKGKIYQFEKIAEGVYYVPSHGFGSNDVVIVNDDDVLLVDTADTPAATRRLLEDLKTVTDKPVRYVVNTHWHFDHSDGNSVFGPDVQIIAQDYVRRALTSFDALHREPYTSMGGPAVAARVTSLEQQLAGASGEQKSALQRKLSDDERLVRDYAQVRPTPPNLVYDHKLVLHRGQREIDLLFLGRGHTGGDTVVYLPKERIVCSGDLMETSVPYMGDAFFDEWIETLGALKRIDFAIDLPGHGVPFSDKGLITTLQSYIADFVAQGSKLRAQGVTAEDAVKRIDLSAYAGTFPRIKGRGVPLLAVKRLYARLAEREQVKSTRPTH